jgi:predicted nucleotidyltransferase
MPAKKNKNHQLNELLTALNNKKKLLNRNFGVIDLAVFGSFVKNKQEKDSDVDIYVKLRKQFKTFDNFMELRFFLEEMLGRKVDLVIKDSIREELKLKIFMEAVHV